MRKSFRIKISVVLLIASLFIVITSNTVFAAGGSNAGVGIINVPPNYADIKIMQKDNMIRVYLTLSDYNSWSDIYKVQINLEENGAVLHSFVYKQWEDADSFNLINEFIDESSSSLLKMEACDVSHSDKSVTVADRCQLQIRFVFHSTYFSQLHVISTDRGEESTETFIEYKGNDMKRDSNTLLIPWLDGTIRAELPPYMLDISIFLIAVFATFYIGKKTPFASSLQQVFYETK